METGKLRSETQIVTKTGCVFCENSPKAFPLIMAVSPVTIEFYKSVGIQLAVCPYCKEVYCIES